MSDQLQIDIRPPYLDDAWALCHTSLNGEWFHVDSHSEAVETLQDRLTEFTETGSSPDEEQIAIDCHPDYSSALTTSELLGSGLSQFGITSGGQFDSSHWYEHQTEYEQWVSKLAAKDAEEKSSILHVALSEPDREDRGSNPWEWTRAVWIQPQASGSGYNVVLHDASNYAWAIQDNWQTSGVVRILQGDWPMTHTEGVPAPTAVPRYQLNVRRADEHTPPSHLEWPGIDSAETATLLSDPDGTPFDSDFEYCQNVPSEVNGWEYTPTRLTGHERWEQSDGHAYVKILHHHTDFSWVEVGDDRLGGVRGRFPPDSLPGKVQAEYSDAEARSVAIDWMKTHDPELWSHPGHHECLHQPPEEWTLAKEPRVVQDDGQPGTLRVTYEQSINERYTRRLVLSGPVGQDEYTIQYEIHVPSETRWGGETDCAYVDEDPVALPARQSCQRTYERLVELAESLHSKPLTGTARRRVSAWETDDRRFSGPRGAATPDSFEPARSSRDTP